MRAVGALDELNTALGMAKATAPTPLNRSSIEAIQRDLVNIMGEVACAQSDVDRYVASKFVKLAEADLARIDAGVSALEAENLRFDGWATPGANVSAAAFDVARTVARRAERELVALVPTGRVLRPVVGQYLNRLADLLWLMARQAEKTS